ncbi:putative MFS multidrug transporter [Bisporella sp. PMI_857]|nr:putative MFS multidrug transporter [Bisporella sp. PMI_857]
MENRIRNERSASQPKPLPAEQEESATTKPETAGVQSEDEEYIGGFKLFVILAAITVSCFLMMLDTSVIVTAIPRITSHFHSLDDVGWYGSAYLLASCSFQPLTGKIYSIYGSKRTFISFLTVFELGSFICGIAKSSHSLILGRAIAGLGGSGLINGALIIIASCVPLEARAVKFGMVVGIAQFGIVFGPLLGGALTDYVSWRWCFYINLPIGGVMALVLLFVKIPDRTTTTRKTTLSTAGSLDLYGFVIFAPTVTMFLLALEWGGIKYAWNSGIVIGLFCASGVTFIIFLAWEYRMGDDAMIPLSMIRQRVIWSSCAVMFFLFSSLLMLSYYLPIYFQTIRDVSPTLSGVYILPGILSQMIFAVVSGILVGRLGYYLPWIVIAGILPPIGQGLISTFNATTPARTWIGYQIIGGIGRGFGLQMPLLAIQAALRDDQIPVGTSLAVFAQTFGGALLLSLAQTVFASTLKDALPRLAPGVNPQTVIKAGASAVRTVIPADHIEGVLLAYNEGITNVFYLAAGTAGAVFVVCWGMGWKSVKKAKKISPEA